MKNSDSLGSSVKFDLVNPKMFRWRMPLLHHDLVK